MVQLVMAVVFSMFYMSCKQEKQQENTDTMEEAKTVDYHGFKSGYIEPINVDVWLPKGYSKDKKYAVLYMHDGQNLFDSLRNTYNYSEWHVDEILTDLMDKGEVRETIVVGIWNQAEKRYAQYFPQKVYEILPGYIKDTLGSQLVVYSDNYLKFITKELKPFIDKEFSTLPDEENTFVAGSSMGGLISMYAMSEYPEVFGGAACFSTHWIGMFNDDYPEFTDAFVSYLSGSVPSPGEHKFYFDHGTVGLDSFYGPSQKRIDSLLRDKGYNSDNLLSMKYDGHDHSEASWSSRLDIPLKFLLGKK